jgi:hypothetical protein
MFAVGFLCRVLTTHDFSCMISFSRSHTICLNKCSEGIDGEGYDRNSTLTCNCCQKHLASSVYVCVCMCVCVSIFLVTHDSLMSVQFSKLVASHLHWRTSFQSAKPKTMLAQSTCGYCYRLSHCSARRTNTSAAEVAGPHSIL